MLRAGSCSARMGAGAALTAAAKAERRAIMRVETMLAKLKGCLRPERSKWMRMRVMRNRQYLAGFFRGFIDICKSITTWCFRLKR